MCYQLRFAGGDDVETQGRIFQMDDHIFLFANGLTVKVRSTEYHNRMNVWIEGRMQAPLVFVDGEARCTMTAPVGGGDVVIELKRSKAKSEDIIKPCVDAID